MICWPKTFAGTWQHGTYLFRLGTAETTGCLESRKYVGTYILKYSEQALRV